jgi:hypothetical protein
MDTRLEKTITDYFGLGKGRRKYPPFAMAAEIETEGRHLPFFESGKYWRTIEEGSLRNGGREHIFKEPIDKSELDAAFREWDDATVFSEFVDSIRTSVHLHYNVKDLPIINVYSVLAAYWLVENILVKLNGESRVGNLFCLRVQDAEYTCQSILTDIKKGQYFYETAHDGLRYSALNLAALRKFGSLEFRFLKGYHESNVIKQWMLELHKFVTVAASMPHPQVVLKLARSQTPEAILSNFFSPEFVKYIYTALPRSMVKGMLQDNEVYVEKLVNALIDRPKKKKNLKFIDEDMPGRDGPPIEVAVPDDLSPYPPEPYLDPFEHVEEEGPEEAPQINPLTQTSYILPPGWGTTLVTGG